MDIAWIALPVLAVFGLLILGAVITTVILLANRKTRPVGIVFLAIGLLFVGAVGLFALAHRGTWQESRKQRAMAESLASKMFELQRTVPHEEPASPAPVEPNGVPMPDRVPVPAITAVPDAVSDSATTPDSTTSLTEGVATDESVGILRAIGRALGKAISDNRQRRSTSGSSDIDSGSAESPVEDAPVEDAPVEDAPVEEVATDEPAAETEQSEFETPTDESESEPEKIEPASPTVDDGSTEEAQRPARIVATPRRTPDGIYRVEVEIGPYTSSQECDIHQDEALQATFNGFVEDFLGRKAAGRVRLTPAIRQQIHNAADDREVIEQYSFGPMIVRKVGLTFDHKARKLIEEEHDRAVVTERLWYTGTAATAVLAILAVLFGGLKIDQATDGVYRGRLGFVAVLAGLGTIAATWWMMNPSVLDNPPVAQDVASILVPVKPVVKAAAHTNPLSGERVGYNSRLVILAFPVVVFGAVALSLIVGKRKVALMVMAMTAAFLIAMVVAKAVMLG